jgi:hypothetical protein
MGVSPALIALFNQVVAQTGSLFVWRCYTITLNQNSGVLRFADSDFDIKPTTTTGSVPIAGFTYSGSTLRVDALSSKSQVHFKVGLDTDQYVLVVAPRSVDLVTGASFPDKIGSVPFLQAASAGAFAAADVQVDEAYFGSLPTWPMPAGGATPVGCRTIFRGVVGEVDTDNTIAVFTFNDYRSLLQQIQMPRRQFQAQCRHNLFGPGCNASGLSRATYAKNGVVGAGSTQAIIIGVNLPVPGGSGTYNLGSIQITSGPNSGFWRTITNWDGANTITVLNPFPFPFVAGDTFSIAPGCNWLMTTCALFNNLNNYGGQPFIPPPEVTTG